MKTTPQTETPRPVLVERMVSLPVELAQNVLEGLYDLRGERDWWQTEPRRNYQRDYKRMCDVIAQLEAIIRQANHVLGHTTTEAKEHK